MQVYHDTRPVRLNDLVALRLTPTLLEALKQNELTFKADQTSSYVCTKSATFRVMASSCNPTVCLLEHRGDHLQFTDAVKSNLSTTEVPGSIDWSGVPVYGVQGLSAEVSLAELKRRNFCSVLEFEKLWAEHGGLEIDGNACIIADELVYKLACEINAALFQNKSLDDLDHTKKALYTAVHGRLWPEKDKATKWVGVYLLRNFDTKSATAFRQKWQRDMLGEVCPMDLLAGLHIQRGDTLIPTPSLDSDPKKRLAQLFEVKPDWTLPELVPFITDFCSAAEAQTFVKRFAKIVNTSDPLQRGKIIKKVIPLNY